ncbi:GNAT family N-acetyltransferase [Candidatus Mycobacterium wuenschmannii]|uniref:N-acetyltransferase Eis n=1 Tax=Candidatus Mycobacterium wuenschmannii TaxID=3027808 RepID=A0ABY8W0S2_9MYCO|nr:GNAT family N-acetyltransferase [Candidatus Mycobacterium wuenschmannii]WIM88013.1 GNAT family N-acetyltransferase [Candidatus Mycobacterium wuenschmannii]
MTTTSNDIVVRHPNENDWDAVYANQARTFGDPIDAASIEAWKQRVKLEDILIAEDIADPDDPFIVGTTIVYRTLLTVPGGARLRAAWLTMTAVASTHQGRGVWAQLSLKGLEILIERGYPIVCGVPTQTEMYDNVGAGVASYSQKLVIDRRSATLRNPPEAYHTRELNAAQARHVLPEIYERWCTATNGAVQRTDAWWNDSLEDRPTQRGNGSVLNCTTHPDGFLTYRVVGQSTHAFRPPLGSTVVEDFCAVTDEAHTELLAALLTLEMFDHISIDAPLDDALPLKLTDLRAAEVDAVSDWLWVRINDVPEALGARGYMADADVALEVVDPLDLSGGRFLLQVRDGAGKCLPHEGPADIEISLADLGTIYTGAHRPSELVRAGRITELREGAMHILDDIFRVQRVPFCNTLF